jgi:hypothetical protein
MESNWSKNLASGSKRSRFSVNYPRCPEKTSKLFYQKPTSYLLLRRFISLQDNSSGVKPQISFAFSSAPLSIRNAIMLSSFCVCATCSGVCPHASALFTSNPRFTKNSTYMVQIHQKKFIFFISFSLFFLFIFLFFFFSLFIFLFFSFYLFSFSFSFYVQRVMKL